MPTTSSLLPRYTPNLYSGSGNQSISGIMSSSFNTSEANIIASISSLQILEQGLLEQLKYAMTNFPTDTDKINIIIDKMNNLASLRLNLYTNLSEMGDFYSANVSGTTTALTDQTMALAVVENELNAAKKRLDFVEDQKMNKLRLVEINEYYGKKYTFFIGRIRNNI